MESFKEFLELHQSAFDAKIESSLSRLLKLLDEKRDSNSQVFIVGNGGSASTASHAVVDFMKTSKNKFGKGLRALNISEMVSLCTAYSNDISYESHISNILKDLADPNDLAIFLSVSGQSKNLIEAAEVCKSIKIDSFAIVGSKGSQLLDLCGDGIQLNTHDYQIVEDLHLIMIHWLTRSLQVNI